MSVRVECDMNELIYIYRLFSTGETVLDSLDKCISPCPVVLGKLSSFIHFRKCPGRNLFTEISYLEKGSLRTQNKNLNVQALLTLHEEERFS